MILHSNYSSMKEDPKEMQLLSCTATPPSSSPHDPTARFDPEAAPSVDLQLSMSLKPLKLRQGRYDYYNNNNNDCIRRAEALKWEAAEQIRLAETEKAYAERVMELTRREMELAQSEFLRARALWERAREEVERAGIMRERATTTTRRRRRSNDNDSNSAICMVEITCLSCSHKFIITPS